jgi:hypothetical protein
VHERVLFGPDIDEVFLEVRPADAGVGVEVDGQGPEVQRPDAASVDNQGRLGAGGPGPHDDLQPPQRRRVAGVPEREDVLGVGAGGREVKADGVGRVDDRQIGAVAGGLEGGDGVAELGDEPGAGVAEARAGVDFGVDVGSRALASWKRSSLPAKVRNCGSASTTATGTPSRMIAT